MSARRVGHLAWVPVALVTALLGLGSCSYDQALIDFCTAHPAECTCRDADEVASCCVLPGHACRPDQPGRSDCCAGSACELDETGNMGTCRQTP